MSRNEVSPDVEALIRKFEELSYTLEVRGEGIAVEAREARHRAAKLRDIEVTRRMEGSDAVGFPSAQAAYDSLDGIAKTINQQLEAIRNLQGNIQ